MDCWNILGINPTEDKNVIKQAYMEKLNYFHPEEDPEGFQNLRQAYEMSLKEANELNCDKEPDNSPLGLWMQKVEKIYNKFSMRINPENWQEILQDDVCFQIDSANEASKRLLSFLMDNYRMPQSVWIVLDNHFNWQDKKEELYNEFPPNFIDFIINEIIYEDNLRYDLFECDDDGNYDNWFNLYFKLKTALNERNKEEAKKLVDEIKILNIKQPDMSILEMRYYLQIDEVQKAQKIGEELIKVLPEYTSLLYNMGQVEFANGNIQQAKLYYEKSVEIDKNCIGGYIGVGDCLFEMGDYKEALKFYEDIRALYPYNTYVAQSIYRTNEELSKYYEKLRLENPYDQKILLDLAWSYFDIDKFEQCEELAQIIKADEVELRCYYDLYGRLSSSIGQYEKALEYFDKWLDISEDDDKSYIYKQKARQFESLQDYEKALEYYDKSLEYLPNNVSCLSGKAFILNKLKRYNESLEVCDIGLEINSNIAYLYLTKAEALYNLDKYSQAIDNCEICNDIYPYFSESYIIQLKIYYDVREYQQGIDVVEITEDLKIENNEIKLFKAKLLEALSKYDEAEKIYLELIEEAPDNPDVCYDFAYFNKNNQNYEQALYYVNKSIELEDRVYKHYLRGIVYRKIQKYEEAFSDYNYIIDSGEDRNLEYAYYNKGLLYYDTYEYDKAIEAYNKALEINPRHPGVNNALGEVYERKNMYNEALEFYNRQLEIEEDDYYYINRGWCYITLKRYEEAKKDFETVIKNNSNNIYAYNGIGNLYMELEEYKNAIENFEKILEIDDEYKRAYTNIGECYEELDDFDKAEQYYTEAIEKFPDDESFYLYRGLIYAKQKKYSKAIKEYKKSIEINPSYSYAYNNIGVIYRDLKQYDKALKFYHKAIEVDSSNNKAYSNLGYLYKKLKNYKKAVEYFTLFLDRISEDANIYKRRGESNLKLGNVIEAKKDFEKALSYYLEDLKEKPEYACLYNDIGFCYENIDNFYEAENYYKKAIELAPSCYECDEKQCHESYYRLGKMLENEEKYQEALEYYIKANKINPDEDEYKEAIESINKRNNKDYNGKTGIKKLLNNIFGSK